MAQMADPSRDSNENRGLGVLMSQGGDDRREDQGDSLDDLALDALSAPSNEAAGEAEPSEPIVAHCDLLKFDVWGRIRVFQKACRAVHQSHQKGLIFGDLSPSTLTITADGSPLLPAARDHESTNNDINEWSSPERVMGEPATIASDVYALGALLYELLTGRRPYRVDYGDPDALAEAIAEQAPERPSRAAKGSGRKIKADLDLIVGRALQKEPEQRYASAAELADDLDRWMKGFPILARQNSELYCAGLVLKRQKWIVIALLLFMAGAAAGVVEGIDRYQALRVKRDRTERYRGWATETLDKALDRVIVEPKLGDDPRVLRRGLLEDLGRYYDSFTSGSLWISNAERANAQAKWGLINRELGNRDEAISRLSDAVTYWRWIADQDPGNPELPRRLAEARIELGRTLDSDDEDRGAETVEALSNFEEARKLLVPLADADPQSIPLKRDLAGVLRDEARIQSRGQADAALGSIRKAVKLWEELAWEAPDDVELRLALASSLGLMARIEEKGPDGPAAARKSLSRAVEVLADEVDAPGAPPRLAFDLAKRLNDLAALERTSGAPKAALSHAIRASELLDALSQTFPTEPDFRAELALSHNLQGESRRGLGDRAKAQESADKARALLERLIKEEPDDPGHPLDLAAAWRLIGRIAGQERRNREALAAFQRAIDLLEGRKNLDGPSAYALAGDLALGLSLVGAKDGARPPDDDDPALSPTEKLRREVYAKRAVEALGQAVAQGFDDLQLYRTDPTLDPLRSRADFKELLAKLVAKAKGP